MSNADLNAVYDTLEARSLIPCIEDGCVNGVDFYTKRPCSLCNGRKWITKARAQDYRHAMSYGNDPTWAAPVAKGQDTTP